VREISLRGYQEEAIQKLREGIREGRKNQVLSAPTGAGKCHGINTPILMADGTVRMVQDVRVGDRLLGPDGQARTVLALGRGREPMYRVVPVKGDPYTCNRSHILSLRLTSVSHGLVLADGTRIRPGEDVVNANADVLAHSSTTARHCLKGWRAEAVEFPDAPGGDRPMPPYILGAWLGDGTANSPAVSKPACRMVDEWYEYAADLGLSIRVSVSKSGGCPTHHATSGGRWQGNPILDALRAMGVLGNKHIPHAYRTAPGGERLELLAGLLDSDGHLSRNGYDWISSSERLAQDFAFLARSLGFACYITPCRKGIKAAGCVSDYWRCSLTGDTDRIPCRDKVARARGQKKRHLVHGIKLEPIGDGDYYGFEIDGDGLYLLGDFTVTHNTRTMAYMVAECYRKGRRALFVCDRIPLVRQTSIAFDEFQIPHGVIQGGHWRYYPHERVQVASAQTLAARGWPDADLIVVDEAHAMHKDTLRKIAQRKAVVIGPTATPFARGMANHYDGVVSVTTTNRLIADGFLSPFRVFNASQPNMDGVKVAKGEWDAEETAKRALPVVGDCVAEYIKHGEGRKFFFFGATIAHCEETQRQFAAAGVHCELYTSETGESQRDNIMGEFTKPDSYIRGLLSVGALSKGVDVPDVYVVIIARPLRNSFMEHIQIIGRGLRIDPSNPEKTCTILDHAGNWNRFEERTLEFFENGARELDDGSRKDAKKPEKKTEEKWTKCAKCFAIHKPAPFCPQCGNAYPRRSEVVHQPGELREVLGSSTAARENKQLLYSQLLAIGMERGYREGWAAYTFKEKTGGWPDGLSKELAAPTPELTRWLLGRAIRRAKGKSKGKG
jgi:DNA repair protein RadD